MKHLTLSACWFVICFLLSATLFAQTSRPQTRPAGTITNNFASDPEYTKIREVAAKVLKDFPSVARIKASPNLSNATKEYFIYVREIMSELQKKNTMTKEKYNSLKKELQWSSKLNDFLSDAGPQDAGTIAKMNSAGRVGGIRINSIGYGDGGNPTCVNSCQIEYNNCMATAGCESSLFCLCCIPCSLQYMGCVGRCAIP